MPDWQAALRAYLIEKKHLSVPRQRLEAAH